MTAFYSQAVMRKEYLSLTKRVQKDLKKKMLTEPRNKRMSRSPDRSRENKQQHGLRTKECARHTFAEQKRTSCSKTEG